ncbi:MAG: GMC family oxidoreductase [Gemmatimonadota bacterium]
MTSDRSSSLHDVVIIGSGFGGSMVARELVHAGRSVCMVERGDWVRRGPHNWAPDGSVDLTRHYSLETPYRVRNGRSEKVVGLYTCVGGPSVFYGGVSLRFREADFQPPVELTGGSGALWPIHYPDLEPYYRRAEELLGVAGKEGEDPTEPYRSSPYPQRPPPLSGTSRMIAEAARGLGLRPFHLPLAIRFGRNGGRTPACVRCTTCDTFACAVQAKNDLATTVLPELVERGMGLLPNTVVIRLEREAERIAAAVCVNRITGERRVVRGHRFVLAAGALGTPHLLLASRLERRNPGGWVVGRHLMRHRNAIVFGVFPRAPDTVGEFHKQIGIHDFYFGDADRRAPRGKLGAIQQVQTPPIGLVREHLPDALSSFLSPRVDYLAGLLVMAEDQPQAGNRLAVDPGRQDRFGLPSAVISHRYSPRDLAAGRVLARKARRILREAGALFFYVHRIETFSHAVGTVRMGEDPATSALDEHCRFRGVENLWVVDGSFMPSSAGLNPSLTIAANALRVGERLVGHG